ncbi:MAG: hypothetical protein QME05_01990 [Candidatus Margulisbacteria bacterium]|nr:hypothetical protein [Candidatus Margulisiibacteriota bacterium]
MKFYYSEKFKKLFRKLPGTIKNRFEKQFKLMEKDIRHPSLHVKKMQGNADIWEARINEQYRFTFITFNWQSETVIFRVIGKHDEALNNP